MLLLVHLWFPLHFQMRHAYRQPPFESWLAWHCANAQALLISHTATDPYPLEVSL